VTIRGVEISIPDGQPAWNVTRVTVVPYLDAVYADVDEIDLQVSAKEAGTDIVVAEKVIPVGNLTSGRTEKGEVSLALENGSVTTSGWRCGRMGVCGRKGRWTSSSRTGRRLSE
jgi:hypothetical protein